MNKLYQILAASAVVAAANGSALADQASAPQVVAIAQVQAPSAATDAPAVDAKAPAAATRRPSSNYLFRGSAFAAVGRTSGR